MITELEVKMKEMDLTEFPEEIREKKKLMYLDLSGNTGIIKIPRWIGELKELRRISLHNCSIATIPKSIGDLKKLQMLNLIANDITYVPSEIGRCTELESLYLQINKIVKIPRSIGKLKKLEYLDLSHNQLVRIPKEIGACTRMKYLMVGDNFISTIPKEVTKLKKLRTLGIQDNPLQDLPGMKGMTKLDYTGANVDREALIAFMIKHQECRITLKKALKDNCEQGVAAFIHHFHLGNKKSISFRQILDHPDMQQMLTSVEFVILIIKGVK